MTSFSPSLLKERLGRCPRYTLLFHFDSGTCPHCGYTISEAEAETLKTISRKQFIRSGIVGAVVVSALILSIFVFVF